MTVNRVIPMYIGESEYINFDFTKRLTSGQTIASATYAPESPMVEVAATAGVSADGTIAQARFTLPAEAVNGRQYTVKCTALCANPTESKILYALVRAELVPT